MMLSREPLTRIPVRHACGHFELRLTRWNGEAQNIAQGFIQSGSDCTQCSPQGRPISPHYATLADAQAATRESILCPDCKSEGPVFKCARCSAATPIAKAHHDAWKRGEFSFAPYQDPQDKSPHCSCDAGDDSDLHHAHCELVTEGLMSSDRCSMCDEGVSFAPYQEGVSK
jgi:hypothetical protein